MVPLVAAVLFIVAVVGIGGFLYYKGQAALVKTDALTLCPRDQPPPEVVAILLDVSDSLSQAQTIQIRNHLGRLRNELPRFARIEVYAITGHARRVVAPVFALCNPGTGSDLNQLYQNPEIARRRWQRFSDSLQAQLDRLIRAERSESSPIFEAIQSVGIQSFAAPEYDDAAKRLVIVSDLLHNVPGQLSMYREVPTFDAFRASAYYKRVATDLQGVHVNVLYVVRSSQPRQSVAHVRFWEQYLGAQGAVVDEVEPIRGD